MAASSGNNASRATSTAIRTSPWRVASGSRASSALRQTQGGWAGRVADQVEGDNIQQAADRDRREGSPERYREDPRRDRVAIRSPVPREDDRREQGADPVTSAVPSLSVAPCLIHEGRFVRGATPLPVREREVAVSIVNYSSRCPRASGGPPAVAAAPVVRLIRRRAPG